MTEDIIYGIHPGPFGAMVIAQSAEGLCWLGFQAAGYKGGGLSRMKKHFPQARFTENAKATEDLARRVLAAWEEGGSAEIALDLRGSAFQKAVWQRLLEIPRGKTLTYGALAGNIGKPNAARAVGSAVGDNPVSLIVPCHRVVPAGGGFGNYGWGAALKEKILKAESESVHAS